MDKYSFTTIRGIHEHDIDLLIMNEIVNNKNFLNIFLNKINKEDAEFVSIENSVRDDDGESDIIVIVKKDNNNIALMIEDKINAKARPNQCERYSIRGESAKVNKLIDEFYVFIVAPQAYIDIDSEANKYPNKVTYEELINVIESSNGNKFHIAMLENAIMKPLRKHTYTYDENFKQYSENYHDFWKSDDIWKLIIESSDDDYLFYDYKKYQESALKKDTKNVKPKARQIYYNVVMDGKRYEIRADLQCTLSEKGATIKFNLSNQKKMQIAVQEASKSIFKHHKEINQILDNIKLLCLNENMEVYIPENDNDAGKTYRLVLKSISNKKISARIEDESYWKKVAYFYGKCSKLMYDMIIEKYVNTQLKVIKK